MRPVREKGLYELNGEIGQANRGEERIGENQLHFLKTTQRLGLLIIHVLHTVLLVAVGLGRRLVALKVLETDLGRSISNDEYAEIAHAHANTPGYHEAVGPVVFERD